MPPTLWGRDEAAWGASLHGVCLLHWALPPCRMPVCVHACVCLYFHACISTYMCVFCTCMCGGACTCGTRLGTCTRAQAGGSAGGSKVQRQEGWGKSCWLGAICPGGLWHGQCPLCASVSPLEKRDPTPPQVAVQRGAAESAPLVWAERELGCHEIPQVSAGLTGRPAPRASREQTGAPWVTLRPEGHRLAWGALCKDGGRRGCMRGAGARGRGDTGAWKAEAGAA